MVLPGNGIFVVRNEMSTLMMAMRRGARWNSSSYQEEEQDGLMKQLLELKQLLNQIEDLRLIDPNIFLGPFLNVIRTEETTGAVTSLALSAVNKFLSYGLIDPTHPSLAITVENIADAVTHARFMGTDTASDGITLMRVVEVLRTLICSPEGSALTNESVCEVMLSCFKICFEPRLNELLRRTAEQALKEMVLLLFMRLPQFAKERQVSELTKKFKMVAGSLDQTTKKRKSKTAQQINDSKLNNPRVNTIKSEEKLPVEPDSENLLSPGVNNSVLKVPPLATTPATPCGNIVDMQGKITQTPTTSLVESITTTSTEISENANNTKTDEDALLSEPSENVVDNCENVDSEIPSDVKVEEKSSRKAEEYVNLVGVRFTQQDSTENDVANILMPYGLPCIQELFRFLILLCNPLDKQNTDTMMHMGLSLLTVALEVGADSIGKHETLLALVKDEMCRNLFSLLSTERLTIFAADLQVCFLLFESLRTHLKFHLEFYLTKISEIIASENPRTPYEMRELALDNLVQLWRIPGFVAELYVNFDCNLYCTDLFESLTKMLSKNTLSATSSIYSTHILSMDTLITVLERIEKNCIAEKTGSPTITTSSRHSRNNSATDKITIEIEGNGSIGGGSSYMDNSAVENITTFMKQNSLDKCGGGMMLSLSKEQLADLKNKKRILAQGTELFNQRPDKGIQFLQENGILNQILDPVEVAQFLRENPGLDKKMIGEYISKKKNVESKILEKFVESFDFSNMRVDQALRLYLETFRLPGEAPLIFLVMEHFADHWHKCNGEPFANTDAAFKLAYAIIMLNMDQHNHNAKRLNVPMTPEDFLKNLRKLNGDGDFDQDMLLNVFNAIKNEEIVMPAEHTGLIRENYLWKVLLRRGYAKDGVYNHVLDATYDKELFNIIWGPTLSALSFMFDKSSDNGYQKTLTGFTKCAGISAFYNLHEDFDALILTLCKFTTLSNIQPEFNDITVSVSFGTNVKAQAAMKAVFNLVHEYGDCMRESWKTIFEAVVLLFRLRLLPKSLMEVEDFCEPNGKATLILEKPSQKTEAGLFSSLYSYLSSDGQRQPSYEEQEIIKLSKKCIRECQIDQIICESKFLQNESLQELLKAIINSIKPPNAHKSVGLPYAEDITVFLMELQLKVVIQNRDRMVPMWSLCRDQMYLLLMGGSSCGYDYLLNRTTIALLKLAIYLMRNEELCPIVLQSLKMLLMLKANVIQRICKQISIGIYELLKTSAQNIHTKNDWQIIFTMLQCIGAGVIPPEFEDGPPPTGTKSDGALSSEEDSGLPDRGYISDSEVVTAKSGPNSTPSTPFLSPSGENWILVSKDSDLSVTTRTQSPLGNTLIYPCKLMDHTPYALFKCWDSLEFIVRNPAHITPYSLESCVGCIRTFVEVCLNGGIKTRKRSATNKQNVKKKTVKRDVTKGKKEDDNSSEHEEDDLNQQYKDFATQLLYSMYTLYTRLDKIFKWWVQDGFSVSLWTQGWCPLLQGIARLAVDRRREVRINAIQNLQSALMVHDLDALTGPEWASCFKQVLFPLLNELLPDTNSSKNIDPMLLEESRIRTATIMSKVFLYHLTSLINLPTFSELWLGILDYIEKFMKVGSDMLYDAMLESLKNMLLVMHSIRVFHCDDGVTHAPLWELTWKRVGEFLPQLRDDLFKDESKSSHDHMNFNSYNDQPNSMTNQTNSTIISDAESLPGISSPRASIILQPPIDAATSGNTLLIGQIPNPLPQQNVPILIPQGAYMHPTHPFNNNKSTVQSGSPPSPTHPPLPGLATAVHTPQIVYPPQLDGINSDLSAQSSPSNQNINQNSNINVISPDSTPKREIYSPNVYQVKNNLEYSNIIELPETPPPITNHGMPTNIGINKSSPLHGTEINPQSIHSSMDFVEKNSPQEEIPNAPVSVENENDSPKVPISHLIGGNQYPSMNKIPPANIVRSFAPMYVQPQVSQSGNEIYMDYVQNPYNLTLQEQAFTNSDPESQQIRYENVSTGEQMANQQNNHDANHHQQQQQHHQAQAQALGISNMFQSANYFGGVDQTVIPPGSEMLFGQP